MAKKKYYAIQVGKNRGIYSTWDECKAQVDGFSGAVYKSFGTLSEAEKFISSEKISEPQVQMEQSSVSVEISNEIIDEKILSLTEDEVVAFVDGSYDVTDEKSGFGAIIIDNYGTLNTLYKSYTKNLGEDFISLRNVAAELEGVKEAINWAVTYKKTKITIYYDYIGIEEWAKKRWKAKNTITRNYMSFIDEKSNYISIEFIKVPAHSGIEYNEKADSLAKQALLMKGFKTYNDGSIYFVGFSVEDWNTIIECINEENEGLLASSTKVDIRVEKDSKKDRIIVNHLNTKVVINCYSNSRSYVQGKQSVLFQKIISIAVELMNNNQTVIETLNCFHALSLTEREVELNFENLLSNYNEARNGKHYHNMLSAVYNTMLVGYMPDYTCLITPIFRAYEYYLHKILGEKMCLSTENDNGSNNFSYFSKNSTGVYECNSRNVGILSDTQKGFLNKFYNNYNTVRHPYSHWSSDDYDTAVITDMKKARELILKGLTLINEYYTIN